MDRDLQILETAIDRELDFCSMDPNTREVIRKLLKMVAEFAAGQK